MSQGPHHASRDRVAVGPDEFRQRLGLLLVDRDMTSTATILLFKAVLYEYCLRLVLILCLDFVFYRPGKDGAVVRPSAFFLPIYFCYDDVGLLTFQVVWSE